MMRRSQLWEDDGNSAPGRGIRECKDPEEERNSEPVRVKGTGGWNGCTRREAGKGAEPARRVYRGREIQFSF